MLRWGGIVERDAEDEAWLLREIAIWRAVYPDEERRDWIEARLREWWQARRRWWKEG